jgi:GDP-4-dehydro-6-deoxy-D-mannose reductase
MSEVRRALVTGVSGFAGGHLARRLLADGWQVAGTVHRRSSGVAGVTEYSVEIDDVAALRALVAAERPTHVFHLAAIVDTVTTPDVMALYRTNTLGTAAVLQAVAEVGGVERVLVTSSAFAYGRPPADGRPVREDDALVPLTPYGSSKVAAEAIAQQWSRARGVDLLVTRAFQHTGPGHIGAYALSDWARQLADGATEVRVGNLDVARDYLDVRDVADAYVAVMESGRSGSTYNVASGVPVTMRTLLEQLVEAFGGGAEIVVDPARLRAVDVPVFVADVTRLHEDTGWRPSYTLAQTMADLAAWYRTDPPARR